MTTVSFQGVSSGLQTDALVSAIIAQDSAGMERLQARETSNTNRRSALSTLSSDLSALTISMAKVYDGINARTVSSTDADNTYVTATATGASDGSYAVSVSSVATKGQLSPTTTGTGSSLATTNLAVSDPNAAILTSSAGTFAVQGTDGVTKTFTLTTNSLYGLRDAINASGAGVTATVVNSGSGDNPYQLVVTANETGTGTTNGVVTLAAIANESDGSATTVIDSLGISSGTLTGTYSAPTAISGGLSSTTDHGTATDAVFTVNGIQLTRKSNTVKDAVDGVTFTIKKASTDNSTTLTVAQDTATATSAMQDLVTKYNALMTYYKQQTAVTKDSSGNITSGVLANDSTARSVINQVRSALNGTAAGISSSAAYKTIGSIGITTGTDGTLTLDTTEFKEALENDAAGVRNLFAFSGTTTNGTVTFKSGSSATATGNLGFNLTYGTNGAITGSLTYGGTTYDVTGSNGTVTGASGTPLEGLVLTVTGSGSGTMTLSRGVGQQLQDIVLSVTSVNGTIEKTRDLLEQQNKDLATRIDSLQSLLDKEETRLKKQFDEMEAIISELKSNSGALSAITSS